MIYDHRGKAPRLVIVGTPTALLLDQTTGHVAIIGERPINLNSLRRAWFEVLRKDGKRGVK